MSVDPTVARLRAQVAANARWAKCPDRTAATAAARVAAASRWERQVDPESTLDPAERAKRVESARRADNVSFELGLSTGEKREVGPVLLHFAAES